ncbi:MAG TPA: sialidase family protein, partial [Armatimonadota bacterium]|nr:sialidase family protein [Armatimonadota bacterium]
MEKRLTAEHGIVCHRPHEQFGYFGWPTVARLADGTLVVASSGLRSQHVCPWGKTVLHVSADDGRTWSAPRVINDSPIDDRDAGIVDLGDGRLLVTWFTSDTRQYFAEQWVRDWLGEAELESWREKLAAVTDEIVARHLGAWLMLSDDRGATWSAPIRVPVSAPHGPIRLRDGSLLYLGKRYVTGWSEMEYGGIVAARSTDGGRTWTERGSVPLYPHTAAGSYHEPHAVELPSGR